VARLWVDCFDYQSNTVIIAELVLRFRRKPVPKAFHESDRLCVLRLRRKLAHLSRREAKNQTKREAVR